jgi:hypothetical protein
MKNLNLKKKTAYVEALSNIPVNSKEHLQILVLVL